MKQADKTMRFGTLFCLVAALAGAADSSAQTNATVRAISLDECVEMALKNNFDLRIQRISLELTRLDLKRSETLYDPTLTFSSSRTHDSSLSLTPVRDPALNVDLLQQGQQQSTRDDFSFGVSGQGPMGMTYNVPVAYSRRWDPPGTLFQGFDPVTFNPINSQYSEYHGSASLELTQPLLKNFSIDAPRRAVLINRKLLKESEYTFRTLMISIVSQVQQAYFDLIFTRENVKVQEMALELAEKLQADNKAKVKAGTLPPLDEKQAESQAAITRADLLVARQQLLKQENVLKRLITKDAPEWKGVTMTPTAALLAIPEVFDLQESWRTSLIKRPDLAQLRVALERNDIDVRYFKSQTLPDLSLTGTLGRNAIATKPEDAIYDLNARNKSVFYGAGVTLTFPWGRRDAKYRWTQSKEARNQAELVLQQQQQTIMIQVDDAINAARTSFDRVGATRQAREYAELALAAEQKKLENGKSTSFFVLQFQRDLTNARSEEIRAKTDYNKALTDVGTAEGTTLERLKINVEIK